jgi:GTP cyclohydrolase I
MTSTLSSGLTPSSGSAAFAPQTTPLPVSVRIRQRLDAAGIPYLANDNIAEQLLDGELDQLEIEVAGKVRELLRSLVIDIDNDHNTEETAERVARMYLHEVFKEFGIRWLYGRRCTHGYKNNSMCACNMRAPCNNLVH